VLGLTSKDAARYRVKRNCVSTLNQGMASRDDFLKVKQRVNQQRANGRFVDHDRMRDELVANRARELAELVANDQRPITERVPEYVVDCDDDGNYIGLKRSN
jgi:hypothetical protein